MNLTNNFAVPPGLEKLAKPNTRTSMACKPDPFTVAKGALSASASERIKSLAKPSRPRSPVERRPPREKDAYGMPIFEMPVGFLVVLFPNVLLNSGVHSLPV